MHEVTLSPAQCRAARALVAMQQAEIAIAASVARKTLADFEAGKTTPNPRTLQAIRQAFEGLGVEFIAEGAVMPAGGAGVRLAKSEALENSQ